MGQKKQLKEIATIYYGKSPKDIKTDISDIPIFGTGGLVGFAKKELFEGPLTVVPRKGTLNNPVFSEKKCWVIDTAYAVIGKNGVDAKWLYYNFSNYNLPSLNEATGVPSINRDALYNILFYFPPLPEQKKIAEILTAVDDRISSIEDQIQQTEQLKKGLMAKLLTEGIGHTEFQDTEIGRIPKAWDALKISEIATYRRGSFPQPYGLDKWYDDENGHPFVQVYDVGDNMKLKDDTKRRISDEAAAKSVFVKKGTLILAIQGSIGRIAITHYDTYIDRTLLIFQSFLLPTDVEFFMYMVFRLFDFEKQKAHGSTIKTITKEQLSDFVIAFPPLPEQKYIASILSSVDEKIETLITKKTEYQTLKKGLMAELLTGQIRVKV